MVAFVQGAGVLANGALTDEHGEQAGLWLTDEHDESGLARPVASLMARHAGPGVLSPDLSDAVAALVALAVYASKQLTKLRDLKRARRAGLLPVDHSLPTEDTP